MAKKFPNFVHVKWEDVENEPWMACSADPEGHLETGGEVEIACYKLVEIKKGKLVAQFTKSSALK